MKTRVFSIFDAKAEAYLQPFYAPTKAVALRTFARAAQDEATDFHRFAEDYTLFEIGEFDQVKGRLVPHEVSQPLGCAIEYKQQGQVAAATEALRVVGDQS